MDSIKSVFVSFMFISVLIIHLIGCTQPFKPGTQKHIQSVTHQLDDQRLVKADETPEDWLSYGRNYQENRFSPLKQINKSNIDQLGLAWSLNLGTRRGIEATPIVIDGIMYVTGPWSLVFAINTRTGELLWKFDPEVPKETGKNACCDVVNRGAALYKEMVYVGTLDGRLIALDAATGNPVWETMTIDTTKAYTITGAPRIAEGKVIIGNGGAEYGVRGYITAYDAITGEKKWRFYTVPGNPNKPFESEAMEKAAETWTGEWWKYGGGGTAWDAMSYDPELNQLYIGVGNGSPWNRLQRSPEGGDNLYLSSIIALNPDNGEMLWHYQTTPGDSWDYTATQHLILSDLKINGQLRKVIMQAPKNGFFYVLDRTNGEFISAEPYVYVNWAKKIDKNTGRPIENDFSRYVKQDVQIYPSIFGGHNWQPMAFNLKTKIVYIPSRELSTTFGHDPDWEFRANEWNVGIRRNPQKENRTDSLAPKPIPQGKLLAWDPVKQKEVWRVLHESAWNGGVLTTGTNLVFQGTAKGNLVAYDAENGEKLWQFNVGTGIIAPPITYKVDGKQYISIAVGWGGARGLSNQYTEHIYPGTIYTFGLNENEQLPNYPESNEKILANFDYQSNNELLTRGESLYNGQCSQCHGKVARGTGGVLPDLGYIDEAIYSNFENIVLKGAFLAKGMPSFKEKLNKEEVSAIKNFIVATASSRKKEINNEDK